MKDISTDALRKLKLCRAGITSYAAIHPYVKAALYVSEEAFKQMEEHEMSKRGCGLQGPNMSEPLIWRS